MVTKPTELTRTSIPAVTEKTVTWRGLVHLLVIYTALVGVVYLATHRILQATLPPPRTELQ